jgi:RimJ/RimL family protein N-acetyltransferase
MPYPEVTLRSVEEADLDIFYEHQADAGSIVMAGVAGRDAEAHRAHWAQLLADESVHVRTTLAGGVVVGNVLSFIRGDVREVGYWLGRPAWGQGIASRALRLFLDWERERPLHAFVIETNLASRRVLEKAGFEVITHENGGLSLILL